MSAQLVAAWHAAQERMLVLLADTSDEELRTQYHSDLSPLGWHLGHTAVVEAFWLEETVAGIALPPAWKAQFFPESAPKAERGAQLPAKPALADFMHACYAAHRARVAHYLAQPPAHPLWARDYLLHFLIQHYAQHEEIQQQILVHRQMRRTHDYVAGTALEAAPAAPDWVAVAATRASVGDTGNAYAYDNELPAHRVQLSPYRIARTPVTNAQYLGFMQAGGYSDAAYWTHDAWQWRGLNAISQPCAWQRDAHGHWYHLGPHGPEPLAANDAVVGISYYEALAYARYAHARLPHELEWEHALKSGAFAPASVGAWEWCANTFYPYPGFRAFPYDGYSLPWFDGHHYTLRGGSRYTAACIRRASFRNFYTADKRHVFAGLRLALD